MNALRDRRPDFTKDEIKPRSGTPRRGAAQDAPVKPDIVTAARLALSPDMTIGQGFEAIAANCLAHIRGNEAGAALGQDPESVHQMRVGLRRLRSALRLFRDLARPPASLEKDIAWLSERLCAARDWEVLALFTLPAIEEAATGCSALPAVRAAAARVASARRRKLAAAVRTTRYTRLMKTLTTWIESARFSDAPLADFADGVLVRDRQQLIKHGRALHKAGPQARHRLRIATKRARYAAEFFQSLYPPRCVSRYARPLIALQDELGRLNDYTVALALVGELLDVHPDLAEGACFAQGFLAARTGTQGRKLRKLWRRFKAARPPCRE